MAISYLGSVTGVAGGSLSLTSLGLQENDFLFAIQVQDTGTTVTPISGWTNYFDEPRVDVKLVEDYLVCGSSPPTSVTVSGDSSTSVIIAGFRGVDPAAPFDTTSRTALGNDNANLDPPAITTIGDDSYVIAVGGLDDDLVESSVTAPTGYTLIAAKEAGGGQTAMMAYKEVSTAGVEDPGTFGIGSGNDDWIARTHSLRAEGVNPPWTLIDEVTEEIAPGAGSATVNLPTSAEGDIVVFILGSDSGLSTPAITDSGWNLEQFSDDECCIGWKIMGSTPDTTVTVPRTADRYAAFAAQAYRGGDGTQPDAALQTATGSSSVPDPPSITTVTDDALVIAFGQLDDEVITFTAPSGYGRLVEANTPSASSPGNDGASVVIASRRVPTAGTENPGTFAAIENDNWYGATIAFTLAVGGGTDAVSADSVESASEVTSPSLGQVHSLSAGDVESAPEVSAPAIGQVHVLAADGLESASEVTSPALGQVHGLAADSVEAASEVTTPTIGVASTTDALSADAVESASEVTDPSLGQVHGLSAGDVEAASEVTAATLGQVHGLSAGGVESASEVTQPTLAIVSNLAADSVEAASEVTPPDLGQIHNLGAAGAESVSEVTQPAIGVDGQDAVKADSVEAASEVTAPDLGQVHNLSASAVQSQSEVSVPRLNGVGADAPRRPGGGFWADTLPENVEAARSRKRKKRIEDERKQREALRRAYEEVTGEAEPQVAAVPQEVRQEVVEAAVTRIADDWQAPNFDFDAQFAKIEALFVQIEAEARQREQQEATRRRRERDAIAVLLMVA